MALRAISLCTGYGGLELGIRLAGVPVHTVAAVERQAYAAAVLAHRMVEGALDPCPIWDDLESFDGCAYRDRVDLVVAGFPCQGSSVAGKRRGTADERWLWPQVWRIVRECGASLLFVENVPGLLSVNGGKALGEILGDLAASGWAAEWDCVPAAAVGAPHVRDRWFCLAADPDGIGLRQLSKWGQRRGGANERPSAGRPSLTTMARTGELSRMLPTPQASDAKRGGLNMSDRGKVGSLTEALCDESVSDEIRRLSSRPGGLPTPTAQDCRASGVAGNWSKASGRNAGATLTDVAVRGLDTAPNSPARDASTGIGDKRLNPAFVEWMMGTPPGWTSTRSASTCSETESSHRRQHLPGECSQIG